MRWRIEAEWAWSDELATFHRAKPPKHLDAKARGQFIRNVDTAGRIHSSLFPEDD